MTLFDITPVAGHVKVHIVKRYGLWWFTLTTTNVFFDRWGVSRTFRGALDKVEKGVLAFMQHQQGN